jgi:ABC-type multidrug transport system ATPase subunit
VHEWIFKNVSLDILPAEKMVILGANGSGKSTLLQSIASFLIPTQGAVTWQNESQPIEDDAIYKHLSMASPYMELIEDFTLPETIEHQKIFKPFIADLSAKEIIQIMQL